MLCIPFPKNAIRSYINIKVHLFYWKTNIQLEIRHGIIDALDLMTRATNLLLAIHDIKSPHCMPCVELEYRYLIKEVYQNQMSMCKIQSKFTCRPIRKQYFDIWLKFTHWHLEDYEDSFNFGIAHQVMSAKLTTFKCNIKLVFKLILISLKRYLK